MSTVYIVARWKAIYIVCATPPPSRAVLTRMPPLKSRVVPDQSAESPNFRKLKPELNIPPGSQWTTYNVAHRFTPLPSSSFLRVVPKCSGDRYTKTDSRGIIRTRLVDIVVRESTVPVVLEASSQFPVSFRANRILKALVSPHGAYRICREAFIFIAMKSFKSGSRSWPKV
jgi:hypothetical protein